jgi:hypothetical protein
MLHLLAIFIRNLLNNHQYSLEYLKSLHVLIIIQETLVWVETSPILGYLYSLAFQFEELYVFDQQVSSKLVAATLKDSLSLYFVPSFVGQLHYYTDMINSFPHNSDQLGCSLQCHLLCFLQYWSKWHDIYLYLFLHHTYFLPCIYLHVLF